MNCKEALALVCLRSDLCDQPSADPHEQNERAQAVLRAAVDIVEDRRRFDENARNAGLSIQTSSNERMLWDRLRAAEAAP